MSFVKKIWKDRISQFPNRRTINDGYVTKQVTVGRDEGAVTEEGTPFDATEMNDLENRIYAAIEQGGGGGGSSGTYDYTELFNKPRINNHELDGNKSLGDLGIASNADELPIESGSATNTKDYIDSGLSGKADKTVALTLDYTELNVALDASGEGTLFTQEVMVLACKDLTSDSKYVGYVVYFTSNGQTKVKSFNRSSVNYTSNAISETRKIGVRYLKYIS